MRLILAYSLRNKKCTEQKMREKEKEIEKTKKVTHGY